MFVRTNTTTRGRTFVFVATLAGAGLAVAAMLLLLEAAEEGPPGAVTTHIWQDDAGDADGGPDITSVVSSDDGASVVSIAAVFANRTSLRPGEAVAVHFDTDPDLFASWPTVFGASSAANFDYTVWFEDGVAELTRSSDLMVLRRLTTNWEGTTLTFNIGDVSVRGRAFAFGLEIVGYAAGNQITEDDSGVWLHKMGHG